MRFIHQRNRYECTACAVAMVCDCDIQEFIDYVGHDGSEIVDPNLQFPMCHRGFTMEEGIDFALTRHVALVKIDAFPVVTADGKTTRDLWPEDACKARMNKYLEHHDAILIGEKPHGIRNWHTVVWGEGKCHDPSYSEPLSSISINVAQAYLKLNFK